MSTNIFKTELLKKHKLNQARVTKVTTPHGEFFTPAFMPVGTKAVVNIMSPEDLTASGSQIILGGNTYHMLCNPGLEVIQSMGGMHQFMNWHKPMLTDSGGFQVLSLAKNKKICKIDEHGASFKHPIDGRVLRLTPSSSIAAQKIIGADIIMAFDQCTPEEGGREAALDALERTHRWLLESKEEHEKNPLSAYGFRQALFGIIQGGSFRDLRESSTQFVLQAELDGVAIGGEVVGFDMPKTLEILTWIEPMLPETKLRYTMGVGLHPQDLIDVVANGVDIFDCVAPTRNARHGSLYCGEIIRENGWIKFIETEDKGRLMIKRGIYAKDHNPIMAGCDCHTCRNYTRAYLHYLFKTNPAVYSNLACIHNIHVLHEVCAQMRDCINNS